MAGPKALGQIKTIPLREVWPNEREFTRWLADHIDLLGKATGLDLELLEREVPAGPFSVDLAGQEVGSGRPIVIENQLEVTDHSHLGQLLTYAADHEAGVAVWIAASFKDEHRQVLDWLNESTPDHLRFFGVAIDLMQIGDSLPAPHFKLVASPNEIRKGEAAQTETGERGTRYRQFWKALLQRLVAIDSSSTTASADRVPAQNWYGISAGRSGFPINFVFGGNNTVRVEIYIDTGARDVNKHYFDVLEAQRSEIENAFGEPLDWARLDQRKASRISVERTGRVDDPEEVWPDLVEWGAQRMIRAQRVFRPRLRALPLPAVATPASLPGDPAVQDHQPRPWRPLTSGGIQLQCQDT